MLLALAAGYQRQRSAFETATRRQGRMDEMDNDYQRQRSAFEIATWSLIRCAPRRRPINGSAAPLRLRPRDNMAPAMGRLYQRQRSAFETATDKWNHASARGPSMAAQRL